MTARDALKCESASWSRPAGRKMLGRFDFKQLRIDHAKRIFTACLLIAVYGIWIAGLLLFCR